MKTRTTIIIILLIGMMISCKKESDFSAVQVDAEIATEMEKNGIPSLVACIVKNDQIVWEKAYGQINIKKGLPADRETVYTLMSISKLFIAVSVMQLYENGKIGLDDDVNYYLPFEVRNPRYPDTPITIRMLLTHTSGIAHPLAEIKNFSYLFPLDEMPLISEWLPEYLLPGGAHYQSVVWKDFKPGTVELYSNIGSSLLALVVENISAMDYRDYCIQKIFDPLDMPNTRFRYEKLNLEKVASPYWNMHSSIHHFNYRHYPAGNLKSNTEDFSHFMIALLNDGVYKGKRILKKESIKEMFEIHNPTTGTSLTWADCPGDCIGHSGGGEGFSSRAEWYMDRKKGMFVFTNRYNTEVYPKGRIYELLRLKTNQF